MKSILSLILSMLIALSSTVAVPQNEEDLLDTLSPDCQSVSSFIEDNFELFVEKYNEENDTDILWEAEGIESKQLITVLLLDSTEEAIFLDFSGDDGYAILADNYIMYDFQTEGESPFKTIEADAVAYSVVSGYLYEKDGEYYSINEENNSSEEYWNDQIQSNKTYDGQETGETGCGKIIDPDKYVAAKYGSSYKVDRKKSLPMTSKYNQWDLSVYKENNKDGHTYSEGNCWVVSAYNVLQYYADTKYSSKMPTSSSETTYNPSKSEPQIYKKYYKADGTNISGTVKIGSTTKNKIELKSSSYSFPKLWAKTREYTSSKYGKIQGGTIWQTENIIKNVASKYDVTIKTDVSTLWGATYMNVIDNVERGDAFIWSTSNDTYGSHTMAGCGYRLYCKTTKIWFITIKDYKLFYELKDGHKTDSRFYDVCGHVGFSAIIFLEGK